MNKVSGLKVIAAAVAGAAFAMSAYAAEMSPSKKGEPASVDESRPDRPGMDAKGKSGVATMPGKGPASVSESAPDKTGKEPVRPAKGTDSKNMPNPKTPSSVDESRPDKTGMEDKGDRKSSMKKRADKDKDGTTRY